MTHRGGPSWKGVVAFTAGVVSGWVALLVGGRVLRGGRRPGDYRTLPRLIFGYTKREVARLLGPPAAAAVGAAPPPPIAPAPPRQTFWQANVWYYPVDPQRQRAVAVQFDADRVVKVEILGV